jgi:hypothetical protein
LRDSIYAAATFGLLGIVAALEFLIFLTIPGEDRTYRGRSQHRDAPLNNAICERTAQMLIARVDIRPELTRTVIDSAFGPWNFGSGSLAGWPIASR